MRLWCVASVVISLAGCATALDRLADRIRARPWHLNQVALPDADDAASLLASLERRIADRLSAVIVYGETASYGDDIAGLSFIADGKPHILIKAALSSRARLVVLAHEGGHLLQPPFIGNQASEVFAAGVGFLVCRRLGKPMDEFHEGYLAQLKSDLDVLVTFRADIEYAASALVPVPVIAPGPVSRAAVIDTEDRDVDRDRHDGHPAWQVD